MRLFRGNKKNYNGLEIISIHIPKTAGRSFLKVLEQLYGSTLDGRHEKEHFFPDMDFSKELPGKLPDHVKVIHGHLTIAQVRPLIDIHHSKVITWVREPVDRIISNYYYFMQRIRDGRASEKQLRKENFSLLEYATQPRRRNMMSKILEGLALEDFYFIGVMEQFEKDLAELSSMMAWPDELHIPHINANKDFKHDNNCTTQYKDIDLQMREEIARLNESDVSLYLKVKKMRGIL